MQLSELLYRLATLVDGRRDLEALARDLGAAVDLEIRADQVAVLLDAKLRPAGLLDDLDRSTPVEPGHVDATRPDPLLMLKYRVGLVPPRIVARIAAALRPMFYPPVLVALLGGFVALDAGVVAHGGISGIVPAARDLFYRPGLTLLVLALVLAAAAFHECGHVTACRYGGAEPGVMGVGLYLVWPAFYSTVTDTYRLDRRGRLRTDLGGIYFNAVFMAATAGAYLGTGAPWLLVTLVLMHVETAWQFLPSVRLDGYYILADLVGVPDLFNRLGPVLISALPGRPPHPRVAELKPWTRRIITLWVALVIPCLLYWGVAFVLLAPRVLPIAVAALGALLGATDDAFRAGHVTLGVLGVVQIGLLVLPYAGTALIAVNLARRVLRIARARRRPRTDPPSDVP